MARDAHHVVDLVAAALATLGRGAVADEGVGSERRGVGADHGVHLQQELVEESPQLLLRAVAHDPGLLDEVQRDDAEVPPNAVAGHAGQAAQE